jgi:hypothetical protein
MTESVSHAAFWDLPGAALETFVKCVSPEVLFVGS